MKNFNKPCDYATIYSNYSRYPNDEHFKLV